MASGQAVATWNTYRNLNLGVTGQQIKTTPGEVGGWFLANNAAAVRYIKLYDTNQTPDQTFTPKLTIVLPANSAANVLAPAGVDFTSGIAVRATTGVADNDTGAPAANDVIVNIFYK
jgi:hypothetical protein